MKQLTLTLVALMVGVMSFASASQAQRSVGSGKLEPIVRERLSGGLEKIRIRIGREEGWFERLAIKVLDRPLRIRKVVIVFANGQRQNVKVGTWYDEDEQTEAINLDGRNPRFVRAVVIHHRPMPSRREARIEVLGERAGSGQIYFSSRYLSAGEDVVTLPVRSGVGRLEKLGFRVDGNPLRVRRAVVTFANGETKTYRIRARVGNAETILPLEFGRKTRTVEYVDVYYRKRSAGRSQLTLVGQPDYRWLDWRQDWARSQYNKKRVRREAKPRSRYNKELRERNKKGKWVLLGAQKASRFRADTDVFSVGKSKGRFKAIRVTAKRHDVRVRGMRIIYGNGSYEDVSIYGKIKDGYSSEAYDLKGKDRYIDKIAFKYQTTFNFKGSAVIELWGLRVKK